MELKRAQRNENICWRGLVLAGTGMDFNRLNLKNSDFAESDLDGANFKFSNLKGANLENSDCVRTDFTGSDLRGAVLEGACFDGAILVGTHINKDQKQYFTRGQLKEMRIS